MPQSSVKKVSAKEKLTWPKDLYDPPSGGWASEESVGLATKEEACLV